MQPETPSAPEPEATTPSDVPELDEWPTHGGPLGCLLFLTLGCVLAGFFASPIVWGAKFAKGGFFAFNAAAVINIIILLIVFGVVGWIVGKRIFREYPAPQRRRRDSEPEPSSDSSMS